MYLTHFNSRYIHFSIKYYESEGVHEDLSELIGQIGISEPSDRSLQSLGTECPA
jgi:hypothetical protein